eukprot:SAG31_NODE_9005_length_1349_cov_1.406400_2_plen_276_part_00
MNPDVRKAKGPWSEEEEETLIEAHRCERIVCCICLLPQPSLVRHTFRVHGGKWTTIARMLPGRTAAQVKQHWRKPCKSLLAKIAEIEANKGRVPNKKLAAGAAKAKENSKPSTPRLVQRMIEPAAVASSNVLARSRQSNQPQQQHDVFVQQQEQRSAAAPQLTETLQAVNDMLQFIFASQSGRAALLERISPWRLEQMRKQLPFVPVQYSYKSLYRLAKLVKVLEWSQRSEAFANANCLCQAFANELIVGCLHSTGEKTTARSDAFHEQARSLLL